MIALALLLAAASGPYADLRAAIDRFSTTSVEAERTNNAALMAMSANTVCTIAYTHVVAENSADATDLIVAYNGPHADRLRLWCVTYFNRQAAIRGAFR